MNVKTSNLLTDLSHRIRQASGRAKAASVDSAEQHLVAGRLLIEAKVECPHGEWGAFLKMAGVHDRQARRLMQLAHSGLKADTVSEMGGIKAALESLVRSRTQSPEPEYTAHPAANVFPMIVGALLDEIANSIRDNGQLITIKLLGGQILDGRGRLAACRMMGIRPQFENLPEDTNPWAYVWSMNGCRHHKSEDQRYLGWLECGANGAQA